MPNTQVKETQREWLSLVTARVRDTIIRKPFYVDGALDLVSVCRQLQQQGLTHALVRDVQGGVERLGIFTTTDLRDALLRPEPPMQLAVREVARFGLVDIHPDAELFEALWLMVRHRVHRLVVRDGDRVLGLLGQLDLVSFVANHSHIVALQIEEATSVADLKAAAARIDATVALMHDGGIKVERIAKLVGELGKLDTALQTARATSCSPTPCGGSHSRASRTRCAIGSTAPSATARCTWPSSSTATRWPATPAC